MNPALFSIAVLFISLNAHAEWQFHSAEVNTPVHFTYTVAEETGSKNLDVVYVLHGGGGSDAIVKEMAKELDIEWERAQYPPPRLVAVSFGPIWMLTPKNQSPISGLLPIFLND